MMMVVMMFTMRINNVSILMVMVMITMVDIIIVSTDTVVVMLTEAGTA
jgi:hypothetical protein